MRRDFIFLAWCVLIGVFVGVFAGSTSWVRVLFGEPLGSAIAFVFIVAAMAYVVVFVVSGLIYLSPEDETS